MKVSSFNFSHIRNYGLIIISLALSRLLSMGTIQLLHSPFAQGMQHLELIPIFLDIVTVFALGFVAYELAKPTLIPSFVIAIFFGFVSQDVLSFISENNAALSILTTIGAILILFGGGLETPFTRFKNLVIPITSIAFLGTVLTGLIFSISLGAASDHLNLNLPVSAIVVLGIALASTDPASIIPSFKSLLFLQPRIKHVAISESALNDVVGALITGVFLALFIGGFQPDSVIMAYKQLLTLQHLLELLEAIVIGAGAGILGYGILHAWSQWKQRLDYEGEADSALFLAVPIFTFILATLLGGNGFLAVFVTGLLFQIQDHVRHVEHFFSHTIEGFMKPLIFMLLGTLVDFHSLQIFALPGLLMGFLFMFVLRPLTVFLTLSPFMRGHHKFTLKELVFLSFVRETGVIPAVLLVSIKVAGIPGSDSILAIGMWVILLTLILQPPFTPYLAKRLGIAQDLPPFPQQKQKGATAVLCSRGRTFLRRLDHVVEWTQKHHVDNILLLYCPEDKYSEKALQDTQKAAEEGFQAINERLERENQKKINFSFLGRPGTLEENIEHLASDDDVAIIFVGSKMLDYRLGVIKKLEVPFIFVE